MKLVLVLREGREIEWARSADKCGLFGVLVEGVPGSEPATAAAVSVHTRSCRILLRVALGLDHPTTLVEEVNVVDNLSGGRVIAVLDPTALRHSSVVDDGVRFRAAVSQRSVELGPALAGRTPSDAVVVTPPPAQSDLPLWGAHAIPGLHLPVIASRIDTLERSARVAPARAVLTGDEDVDRETVRSWSSAGATHLVCEPPEGASDGPALVARLIEPPSEAAGFLRDTLDLGPPLRWPVGASSPAESDGGR